MKVWYNFEYMASPREIQRLINIANRTKDGERDKVKENSGVYVAKLQTNLGFNDDAMASQVGVDVEGWIAYKAGVLEGNDFLKIAGRVMTYVKKLNP